MMIKIISSAVLYHHQMMKQYLNDSNWDKKEYINTFKEKFAKEINGISAIFITKQYQELRVLMKGQNSIVCCKMQVGRSLVKWLYGRLIELVVQ